MAALGTSTGKKLKLSFKVEINLSPCTILFSSKAYFEELFPNTNVRNCNSRNSNIFVIKIFTSVILINTLFLLIIVLLHNVKYLITHSKTDKGKTNLKN